MVARGLGLGEGGGGRGSFGARGLHITNCTVVV